MKIQVSTVPAEGLRHHADYDPAPLDMERFDVHLREPFGVDAVITLADEELVVEAAIAAPLHLACARCLEEFPQTVRPRAVFSYTVRPTETVDITDDVRQEIILAYPMVPICRSDCKGLCSSCGQNLNTGTCAHHSAQGV